MDLTINLAEQTPDYAEIAKLIIMGHSQFTEIYDGLAKKNNSRSLKMVNLLRKPPADPALQYQYPLEEAYKNGWLEDLITALLQTEAIAPLTADAGTEATVQLQAIMNDSAVFLDYGALAPILLRAGPRVCLIRVTPSNVTGTGFLIGPQVVLTAWHVIRELLDPKDLSRPLPGSGERLEISFDFHGRSRGNSVAVHPDWLLASSKAHESELKGILPEDDEESTGDFEGCLDFAMILLESPVGLERGFYTLKEDVQVDFPCQLTLLQHPGSAKLKLGFGAGRHYWPKVLRTRLLHEANSTNGSSGGLVLNDLGQPVALHQSALKMSGTSINGSVPTSCIAAAAGVKANLVDGLAPLWRTSDVPLHPVFGRYQFQQYVAEAVAGERRIIVVNGGKEFGRTFSISILRTMLAETEHIIVSLSAIDLPTTAEALALLMLQRAGVQSDFLRSIPTANDSNTARAAWLKDGLLPFVTSQLIVAAGSRLLWLVVDDLDDSWPHTDAFELLMQLIAAVPSVACLRVLLLGNRIQTESLPSASLAFEQLNLITQHDVESTIRRHMVAATGDQKPDVVEALAKTVMKNASLNGTPLPSQLAENYRRIVAPAI